jgi:hypothetical protein
LNQQLRRRKFVLQTLLQGDQPVVHASLPWRRPSLAATIRLN